MIFHPVYSETEMKQNSHENIVGEILPRIAQRLKDEAVISAYGHKPITIRIIKELPPIRIIPDLMIRLPNGQRVLVEVANPRDPKRFLGEIVYPQFLGYYHKIDKVIIFVLCDQKSQKTQDRGLHQKWMQTKVFGRQTHTIMMTWSDENTVDHNLRVMLKDFLKDEWCF